MVQRSAFLFRDCHRSYFKSPHTGYSMYSSGSTLPLARLFNWPQYMIGSGTVHLDGRAFLMSRVIHCKLGPTQLKHYRHCNAEHQSEIMEAISARPDNVGIILVVSTSFGRDNWLRTVYHFQQLGTANNSECSNVKSARIALNPMRRFRVLPREGLKKCANADQLNPSCLWPQTASHASPVMFFVLTIGLA